MALPSTKALVVSRDFGNFELLSIPTTWWVQHSPFSIDAWEQLGYAEGYKFLENRKMLIMSMLRTCINALWRRYSWFESMRGS